MKELTQQDIQHVSGAGIIADIVNGAIDAPARELGTSVGAYAGNLASQAIYTVSSTVNDSVSYIVESIFGRQSSSHN